MTQNKKTWFFVEGYCEYRFIWALIYRHYPHVKICRDETSFVKGINGSHLCYITDCGNGEKIPFEINDSYYKIKQAGQCNIVIICDLESALCCSQRKSPILDKLDKEVDRSIIRFVFSKPLIEEIYCFEREKTKEILKTHYKLRNNATLDSDINLVDLAQRGGSPLYKMQVFYKKYGLTFKKTEFADKFFSQFDFKASKHPTVQRLVNFADDDFNGF